MTWAAIALALFAAFLFALASVAQQREAAEHRRARDPAVREALAQPTVVGGRGWRHRRLHRPGNRSRPRLHPARPAGARDDPPVRAPLSARWNRRRDLPERVVVGVRAHRGDRDLRGRRRPGGRRRRRSVPRLAPLACPDRRVPRDLDECDRRPGPVDRERWRSRSRPVSSTRLTRARSPSRSCDCSPMVRGRC